MLGCHLYILYTFILDGVLPINLWLRNHRILIGLSPSALHSIEALLPIRTVWFVTCLRNEAGTVEKIYFAAWYIENFIDISNYYPATYDLIFWHLPLIVTSANLLMPSPTPFRTLQRYWPSSSALLFSINNEPFSYILKLNGKWNGMRWGHCR